MAEPGSCDDIGCTVYRPQDFVDGRPRAMSRQAGRPAVIAALVLVAFVLGLVSAARAGARPQAHARHLTRSFRDRSMSRARTRTITPARPLVFGIYPGGASSTRPARHPASPKRAALESSGCAPRPVRLAPVPCYTCASGYSPSSRWRSDRYLRSGRLPDRARPHLSPSGRRLRCARRRFRLLRAAAVAAFCPNPRFVSLQVTNEANVTNAPDAATVTTRPPRTR